MKKKVLLVGPTYLNLFKDIIDGFQDLGYEVDFIKELSSNKDRLNVRRIWSVPTFGWEKQKKKYWQNLLSKESYNKIYDILFVVDGQGLHHCLFDILKDRNPQLKCFNYLFDTIRGVYKFDVFFPYFDKVFSFDKGECETYGLNWLPIYWIPQKSLNREEYDMFGFGAYDPVRFKVFEKLHCFSEKHSLNSYIKLKFVIHREWLYAIMRVIGRPLGFKCEISLEEYHSPIIVHSFMSPFRFREMTNASKIIIDTHPQHQDGMTARFMWALGARKKIITNNESIVNYKFYTPNQIFVLKDHFTEDDENRLLEFVCSPLSIEDNTQIEIDKYRIDNWIKTIVC